MNRRTVFLLVFLVSQAGCVGCGGAGTRIVVKKGELYYTSAITPEQAAAVARVLEREGWFDSAGMVQVGKKDRTFLLRLAVREGVENDQAFVLTFRRLGSVIAKEVFRSAPVDVHLCDERLNTLKVIAHSPPRPALPIQVTFRPSVGGGSLVAQYRNSSDKYLAVVVALRNATLDQRKDITLSIAPGRVVEHGWAEGWTYMSGEAIWVYHADYEPLSVKVP